MGCNPRGIKSWDSHGNSSWIADPSPCFPHGKTHGFRIYRDLFIGIYNPIPAAELWLIRGPFPKNLGAEESAPDLHIPGRRFRFPSLNASFSFIFIFPKILPAPFPVYSCHQTTRIHSNFPEVLLSQRIRGAEDRNCFCLALAGIGNLVFLWECWSRLLSHQLCQRESGIP